MLKKLLLYTVIDAAFIALIMNLAYDNVYELQYVVNALFVVGILTFFIGLILMTNAGRIFKATGYAIGTLFRGRLGIGSARYKNLFKDPNEQNDDKVSGLPPLIVGGIITIVSVIMSYSMF